MPTGYTADIKDGISFKTFALNCARAFGACVMLRDAPGGGEHIPEKFEPSDYHSKALGKAHAEMAALAAMTPVECERAASKEYDDAETLRVVGLQEKADQRAAYEEMLVKVNSWAAPTSEHEGLHKFMREQIEESIRFDCGGTYYETPTVRLSGAEWAERRRATLGRDLAYHAKEHTEEVSRAETRTAWVKALRASL